MTSGSHANPTASTATSSANGRSDGAVAETRPTYDDVCDYAGLPDTVVRDRAGSPIAGLANYSVDVQVVDDAGADIDGMTGTSGEALLINVRVSHSAIDDVVLSAYRTNY